MSKQPVAVISGITGQDGSFLAEFLLEKGYQVVGIRRRTSTFNTERLEHIYNHPNFITEWGNITDSYSLYRIVNKYNPDEIYNLAAMSHVKVSFDVPEETLDTVAKGTLHLLNIIKEHSPHTRFYQASSSEMYGVAPCPPNGYTENDRMEPASPYACFPAGTSIVVQKTVNGKNGKTRKTTGIKNIEDIRPEDIVLTYNEKTSDKEWNKVKEVDSRTADKLYHISFSNGNMISCTGNHPIYVPTIGWTEASELKVGNKAIQYKYPELNSHLRKGKTNKEYYGEEKSNQIASKSSFSMKMAWKHSEVLDKQTWAERASKHVSREWKNPKSGYNQKNYREQLAKQLDFARLKSIETFDEKRLEQMSKTTKGLWANPKFVRKQIEARHSFPNKLEQKFWDDIDKLVPNEFKYNGDCREEVLIGGKVPDFVNQDKKKIIEVFGNYWHTLPGKMSASETIQHYKKYNYECLIVWEKDYVNNRDETLKRVQNYTYNPNVEIVEIVDIKTSNEDKVKVYNFEVENNHNYFARGILVHNCAKLYAHNLVKNYRAAYGLHLSSGILFNHESPRRGETFVTRKITQAAARIKLGKQDRLVLGNLEAKRDWGHARDYVEAMWLMLQQDKPDDYVIATGETHSVQEFLEVVFDHANLNIPIYVYSNAERYIRPQEVPYLLGDASKAKRVLGWEPKTTFEELAIEMYESDFELAKNEQ